MSTRTCQCFDTACNVNHGAVGCEIAPAFALYRVDMEDRTGTAMCEHCAEDAVESGLFRCVQLLPKYDRRAGRSKDGRIARAQRVIYAADALAVAAAGGDFRKIRDYLVIFHAAREDYRLDYERPGGSSRIETGAHSIDGQPPPGHSPTREEKR